MPGGNFNPAPLRFGASNDTDLEAILNDLLQGVGTAFDVDRGSITWIYLNAIARVFDDVFEQNKRLANQWDPQRMTDFLSRWEVILGLSPLPTDTPIDRRARIQAKIALTGQSPTLQVIQDLLRKTIGSDVYVSIIAEDPTTATTTVPGGATVPGGITIPSGAWFSSVSYVPILVTQPSYMDDLTFYSKVGSIFTVLEAIMPAWTTFDWFRNSPSFPSTTASTGFILDDVWNLDNESFDS